MEEEILEPVAEEVAEAVEEIAEEIAEDRDIADADRDIPAEMDS